ncbi:hypothetical protein [Gemella morbillorum]|uniref:hypothetical protein n=1 Tax=Gemella morbillorum TaxID=29391 RepID=UPI0028D5EFF0|nr:hypothetical protein [Gemella morbillorum]
MKKNILVMLSILIITILSGCQKKEEVSTYEQDRVAQYILDNVELVDGHEIKKIKFVEYEKNTSTQTWYVSVELNSKYNVSLTENYIGGELRFSGFYEEEIKIRANENKSKSIKEIKIEYIKG